MKIPITEDIARAPRTLTSRVPVCPLIVTIGDRTLTISRRSSIGRVLPVKEKLRRPPINWMPQSSKIAVKGQ